VPADATAFARKMREKRGEPPELAKAREPLLAEKLLLALEAAAIVRKKEKKRALRK